ncbi:hypothetical protein EVAR_80808_1 [Eumeta japonica]|uniref:Uncharacterized protein n=1 Tax=Eumeta variegata TaxID=151549 RepID=A0A4C1WE18_EUMVA|nr:hypothetical protein EVAR_80808_1 [Eumeta japonica]
MTISAWIKGLTITNTNFNMKCADNVTNGNNEKVTWERSGCMEKPEFIIYTSAAKENGLHGAGFSVNKILDKCVLGFQEINERFCETSI